MCFSPQKQKYKNDILKLYNNKKLKDNLNKAQFYLISNKHLISRNYEKLKNIKKYSFFKDDNEIGLFLKTNQKILNQSFFNKNKNFATNTYKLADKNLISSYSFQRNILSPNNISKNEKNNTNIFKILNDKKYKKIGKKIDNINKTKFNKSNSVLNFKNININHRTHNKNKFCLDFNKIINKIKNKSGITRNKIKKKNYNKTSKFYFSTGVLGINSLNLNLTTRTKTKCFSHSPSFNISSSSGNLNLSENTKINKNKKIGNYSSEKNKYNNKNRNISKNKDSILFKNKLKKTFFKYINVDLSKSKDKKNDSLSLFDKLYSKLTEKSLYPFLFKMKSKRSSSYMNILKYDKKNNKLKNDLINSNDIATSGSINITLHDELSCEEIHFKAVKYYQEIKKNSLFLE